MEQGDGTSLFILPWKCGVLSLCASAIVGKAIYAGFHIGIGAWEVPVSGWVLLVLLKSRAAPGDPKVCGWWDLSIPNVTWTTRGAGPHIPQRGLNIWGRVQSHLGMQQEMTATSSSPVGNTALSSCQIIDSWNGLG